MIDIYFITSSRSKLEHAKFLCRSYYVKIHKQLQYGIGYVEPRIDDRQLLLEKSIKDAVNRLKKVTGNLDEKFVIIEDTSVIIDSLSEEKEVPGVDVKYWMQGMTFQQLDDLLKAKANNRSVTVRSDLVLFLPKLLQQKLGIEYKHFTGVSKGSVVERELDFVTQPLYPWLSSKTFNKWFVPEGEHVPLSLLDIDKAEMLDFRKDSFENMLWFLQQNGFIRKRIKEAPLFRQLNLFNLSIFIVCGPTCAGKTTLSNYLTRRYGFYHIEASDFMYLSFYEKHGPDSEVKIGDFAEKALKENSSVVVDQIISHLFQLSKGKSRPTVISGFRSPEEIMSFKKKYTGGLDIEEIYIDADIQLRFQRAINRGRIDKAKTLEDFKKINSQQNDMGLYLIKKEINDEKIVVNDGSFDEFYSKFDQQFHESLQFFSKRKYQSGDGQLIFLKAPNKLEHAILISMTDNVEEFLTTTQIAHIVNAKFKYEVRKAKDNISRYFNYRYYPYYEIRVEDGKIKYRLSQTGYSLAHILIQQYSET